MPRTERYYLTVADRETEVTKAQWVQAERDCGFRGGRPGEPSTGGFSTGSMSGSIRTGPRPGRTFAMPDLPDDLHIVTDRDGQRWEREDHHITGRPWFRDATDGHQDWRDLVWFWGPLEEVIE